MRTPSPPSLSREGGSGLITSILGTFLVLATVFLSIEVLVTLHRRTVVTGVASDLARRLARDDSLDRDREAIDVARGLGPGARVVATEDGDDIVITVTARGPTIARLGVLSRLTRITRTVRSHRETFVSAEP
jgi:hypothetical protein